MELPRRDDQEEDLEEPDLRELCYKLSEHHSLLRSEDALEAKVQNAMNQRG